MRLSEFAQSFFILSNLLSTPALMRLQKVAETPLLSRGFPYQQNKYISTIANLHHDFYALNKC